MQTGIIYIQRDKLQVYSPMLPTVAEFRFIPEIIRDLEVLNKEQFLELLKTFIITTKISPGECIIIIGDNASFIKDFPLPQTATHQPNLTKRDEVQEQAQKFIDHVPFEEVGGTIFPLPQGMRAYATNKELYEIVQEAFTTQRFVISRVAPGFILGDHFSAQPTLDGAIIAAVTVQSELIKQYNLLQVSKKTFQEAPPSLSQNSADLPPDTYIEMPTSKPDKKRLLLLGSVFGVLVLILILMIVLNSMHVFGQLPVSFFAKQTSPVAQIETGVLGVESKVIEPAIQIITITSTKEKGAQLQQLLEEVGIKHVQQETHPAAATAKSMLILSSAISEDLQKQILIATQKFVPGILVSFRAEHPFAATVVLANEIDLF